MKRHNLELEVNAIIAELEPKISYFVNNRVKNREDAAEISQETLMKIFSSLQKGQIPDKLENWSYTIAKNVVSSHFRSRKAITINDLEDLKINKKDNIKDPFEILSEKEDQIRIENALIELSQRKPHGKRDVQMVREFYWNRKSILDISKEMNENVGTVKRILHMSRNRLRKILGD